MPDSSTPFVAVRGGCDLRCAWCNYRGVRPVDGGDELERVTRELEVLAARGHRSVGFGLLHTEPTTHAALPEAVARARRLGLVEVTLSTSGLEISEPSRLHQLVEAGVTAVVLALAGVDVRLGDLLLGRAGATEAKLAAIDNCVKEGLSVSVVQLLLRPVLRGVPEAVSAVRQRLLAARSLARHHAAVMDPVAGMDPVRFAALWPRHGEVAWTMRRTREVVPGFEVHIRNAPACLVDRIPGLRLPPPSTASPEPMLVRPPALCAGCPFPASECRGIEEPWLSVIDEPLVQGPGETEPPEPDIDGLAKTLADGEPLERFPSLMSGHGLDRAGAEWMRRACDALGPLSRSGRTLCGFRLEGMHAGAEHLEVAMRSASERLEVVVEKRDQAGQFFISGRRFALSYTSRTPLDSDTKHQLMYAILGLLERVIESEH